MESYNHVNVRELALDMLIEITQGRAYSHKLISSVLDKYNYMESQDKAFLKRLTEGTLERMIQLDYCINLYASLPVNKQKPLIRNLLRLSVYQLLFMDGIPDRAVCNEAVKLAEKRKFGSLKGFVNGVLRNLARDKEQIAYPTKKEDRTLYYAIQYSMPQWLVRMWQQDYKDTVVEKLLQGLLAEHPVSVRLREQLSEKEKEAVLDRVAQSGVTIKAHPYLPYAYRFYHTEGMANLADFQAGRMYVQDVSSMLVAEVADLKGGERILDVCAAPGGKTLHAADKLLLLNKGGSVEARDVSEEKTGLIEENIQRLGLEDIVTTKVWDAAVLQEELIGKADVVIADIPCSGLGIIGKKRDIKYRITPEAIEELVFLQREILAVVQSYVKKGGILIFSTCTVDRRENEENLEWLKREYALEPVNLNPVLPTQLQCDTAQQGYIQLMPGLHETDGFFIAKLKKS